MSVVTRIEAKLKEKFSPAVLRVEDASAAHAGHAGYSEGGESHINALIVSDAFAGVSRVERQKAVYSALAEEMKFIHALALKTLTPAEYSQLKQQAQ